MAKQISNIKRLDVSEKQIKQTELEEITDALSDHKESIIKGIDLLTTLDENGTLDFLNAMIKTKEEAMKTDESDKTSYMGMLKALKEPEINRSITMLLTFMRGMGRE